MDLDGQYEHAKEMWRPFDGGVFAARLSPTAAVRRLPLKALPAMRQSNSSHVKRVLDFRVSLRSHEMNSLLRACT